MLTAWEVRLAWGLTSLVHGSNGCDAVQMQSPVLFSSMNAFSVHLFIPAWTGYSDKRLADLTASGISVIPGPLQDGQANSHQIGGKACGVCHQALYILPCPSQSPAPACCHYVHRCKTLNVDL